MSSTIFMFFVILSLCTVKKAWFHTWDFRMEEVKEVALGNSKFGLNLYKIIKKGGRDKSFSFFKIFFGVFSKATKRILF